MQLRFGYGTSCQRVASSCLLRVRLPLDLDVTGLWQRHGLKSCTHDGRRITVIGVTAETKTAIWRFPEVLQRFLFPLRNYGVRKVFIDLSYCKLTQN